MVKIWTVGHSTRSAEEFGEILRAHGIEVLVDVRTYPGSRRYPQFNREALAEQLASEKIRYQHEPRLGGRRTPRADSHNTTWRNAQFRGYADHMETDDFKNGVRELLELASTKRVAIMCAEAVWWRCHRRIVADYLMAAGEAVFHIMGPKKVEPARLTRGASIDAGGMLTYPPSALQNKKTAPNG